MTRTVHLIRDSYPALGGLDTTLARALLRSVSAGVIGETFRIYSPGRVLAFGKRDSTEVGFQRAAEASRRHGYVPIVRLAGGRAAVFHENTLAFGWTLPIAAPREGIQDRFEALAKLLVRAFARVGVETKIGEIPGEYCPGRFSVHHGAGRKVMGVGQRLAHNAAHVGGVIVVGGAAAINDVIGPVYGALGVDFDPSATGSLDEMAPGLTLSAVSDAIVVELAQLAAVVEDTLSVATVAAGRAMVPDHLVFDT